MVAYSFRPRFVTPIRIGLGLPILPEDDDTDAGTLLVPKRQTIRAIGKRRHARAGEMLQLYTGMRTRQCKKIGEAPCVFVVPIRIDVMKTRLKFSDFVFDAEAFAQADGFASAADMHAFWLDAHGLGKFEGVLIRWEPHDEDGQETKPRV